MHEREKQVRTAVMRLIREDPVLIEDVQRAQDLLAVLEDRPDLADDAERFRTALRSSPYRFKQRPRMSERQYGSRDEGSPRDRRGSHEHIVVLVHTRVSRLFFAFPTLVLDFLFFE